VRRKRKSHVPGTFGPVRGELRTFTEAVITKCQERGVDPNDQEIPDEVVDAVADELYGGWTPHARRIAAQLEEHVGIPRKRRRFL
jgi:hypothetical protein